MFYTIFEMDLGLQKNIIYCVDEVHLVILYFIENPTLSV